MLTANRKAIQLCASGTNTHTHKLSPLHFNNTKRSNSRRGRLHVMPASAEVVSELAQRRDAQFLSEVRLLLLFRRQNLLQRADLLFQLDANKTKKHSSHYCLCYVNPCCCFEAWGRPCGDVLWRALDGSPLAPPPSWWSCLGWLLRHNLRQPPSAAPSRENLSEQWWRRTNRAEQTGNWLKRASRYFLYSINCIANV